MSWTELKKSLVEIAEFSKKVYIASKDNNSLFDYLENLPFETKQVLSDRYQNSTGPIVTLRKKVGEQLLSGKIDRQEVEADFNLGKKKYPKEFTQYRNLFSVLYPFVTVSKDDVYSTMEDLAKTISKDLKIEDQTEIKPNDFNGGRNTGDDHAWFAIYNNSYPNQKKAKQLFFSVQNGKVFCAYYDRVADRFVERLDIDLETDNYDTILKFFRTQATYILNDNYRSSILSRYPIGDLLEKLSQNKIKSWLIKPGERGSMWKRALKDENIRIGWGQVIDDIIKENNYSEDFVLSKLTEYYPKEKENTRQTNNKVTILSFLREVQSGDVVFAVSGVSQIIGVGVISSEALVDEEDDEFKSYHQVDWLIDLSKKPYQPEYSLPIKTVTYLENKFAVEIIRSVFNSSKMATTTSPPDLPEHLNKILYGPPGTGKTFSLQTDYIPKFTLTSISKSREEHLIEIIEDLSWWQVIALTLSEMKVARVPDMMNHEYIKIKSGLSRAKKVLNTIWQQLQAHTVVDSKTVNVAGRTHPNIFDKTADSKWFIVQEKLTAAPELDDFLTAIKSYEKGNKVAQRNYSFITFHQSFSYEDFIEGIKPSVDEDQDDVKYEIKKGVFYHACERSVQLAGYNSLKDCLEDNRESRKVKLGTAKPYGFFIDEINRANISAVFGELITLIEDDKRLGADNEISDIILPYSKTGFGVPVNLQIIGTMNTADRSVEALDTALRRRFSFIEKSPDTSKLTEVIGNVSLSTLLSTINDRIEILLDKDHQIGHSFFVRIKNEDQLLTAFYDKIIPLLQEFFYGDYGKIGLILGDGFVRVKTVSRSLASSNDFEIPGELNDKRIFEIIDYRTKTGFTDALKILLQQSK
jgi:hypothetical protein